MKKSEWAKRLDPYSTPDIKRSSIQLINTLGPYFILNGLLLVMLKTKTNWLIMLPFQLITGLLLVRVFILFHDCTHLSFFKSKKANMIWGHILGTLSYTPYHSWQYEHNIHHGSVGNLSRRGVGDIWTMTTQEYLASPWQIKSLYRLFRHPGFLFTVAPLFKFAILNRIPNKRDGKKEHSSTHITNLGIASIMIVMSSIFGWQYFLMLQIPVLFFASTVGLWLFFVQHQFDEVYWEEASKWDMVDAALKGSTFYRLPRVLDWMSGSIGYHHIHHLSPRIPNYYLRKSYNDIMELKSVKEVNLFESFRLAFLQLYDEKSKKLITFKELKKAE